MGILKKPDKNTEKELDKLPLKKLERAMQQEEEEEKARKEKGSPARSGKF